MMTYTFHTIYNHQYNDYICIYEVINTVIIISLLDIMFASEQFIIFRKTCNIDLYPEYTIAIIAQIDAFIPLAYNDIAFILAWLVG